jgi:glutaryl-CoA dehydrogenase (non-decarboxylating)
VDLGLSEEHQMAARMVREFATREVLPIIAEQDRQGGMADFILPRMAELGILGITIPVKYGGQGMDYIALGLACEELEAVDTSLRVVVSVHNGLNCLTLLQWGTEEQKARFLVPLARGEKIGCGAFTEPNAGSDFARIRTSAKKDGGSYIINGEKMWISLAAVADYAVVTVRTRVDADPPYKGLSTFLVDLATPGVTRDDIHGKLGVRAGSTGWINFQDVRVPAENMLGEEGEGFKITMSAFDSGRYTVAAGATGLIRACLDASKSYALNREAFGGRISDLQLVQAKIANMALDYQASRLLYLKVGWMKNQGLRNTRETSAAKWFATEASFRAASEAVQIHGAYGFSDEYPVERYLRNSKGAMIYEGSNEIQSLIQAEYALDQRQDKKLRRELPAYDQESWT